MAKSAIYGYAGMAINSISKGIVILIREKQL